MKTTIKLARWPESKLLPDFRIYGELPKDTGEGNGGLYNKNMWPKRREVWFEQANKAEYSIMNLKIIQGQETNETMNAKI